jgi:hypothetical protein
MKNSKEEKGEAVAATAEPGHGDHCGKWWEGRRGTAEDDWTRGGEQAGQDVGRTKDGYSR